MPDDIDAIGFVVDVTGVVVDLSRLSCIAPSGPPGQLVAWTEIPSSFAAFRGSGISPVPPMSMILEPGIRPVLPEPLEEEEIPIPPVLFSEGAIRAGLSAPMQGTDGTVPGDVTAGVDPIWSAVPLLPSCMAELLTSATADASFDDEAPVVAVEQAGEALQIPDVETPDMGAIPDGAVRPPPSKLELLLGDPDGHGGVRDSVPTLSGDATAIPVAPPIRFVCAKPGLAASRNRPAVSGSNKPIWRTLRPNCQ